MQFGRSGLAGLALSVLLWLLCPGPLRAAATPALSVDDAAIVEADRLRTHGCGRQGASGLILRRNVALEDAARRWAGGASLAAAITAAGYRAEQSVALHVSGNADALRSALRSRWCGQLADPHYRHIGAVGRDQDVWLILAAPFRMPAARSAEQVAAEVVRLVNQARAAGRRCARRQFAPAPPLQLDPRLTQAAAAHAQDMLVRDYFSHEGSDGGTPAQRIAAAGYHYRAIGENIASGPQNAVQAVHGWLASPGHCANIMDPEFRHTGVAFAGNHRGTPRIYWVQDFGTPIESSR